MNAIRVTLQCDRAVLKMWQKIWSDPGVIFDYVYLSELCGGIEDLFWIGDRKLSLNWCYLNRLGRELIHSELVAPDCRQKWQNAQVV